MHKHTKTAVYGVVLAVLLTLPQAGFAAVGTPSDFIPTQRQLETGTFISMILDAINVVAWIGFDLIDKLLDPDFLFNTVGSNTQTSQIYESLNKIWVLCRNIMNIIFAVILVLAAIYTTIKADLSMVKENWSRFVLGVVLVNFSWLFPLMVVDFANIMTNVVYGIPSELSASGGSCVVPDTKNKTTKPCQIVTNVLYFPEAKKVDAQDTCAAPKSEEVAQGCGYKCHLGMVCIKTEDWNANTAKYKTVIHGLVYNYAKLGDIARLPNTAAPTASASNIRLWLMFIIRQLVSIVIMIALAFPLIALALAFLMRIPIIWVTMAFMPFFFVGWVLEGKIPGADKTKGILNEFLKAAFLPVITALPLCVGFIMMNALASTNWQNLADQLASNAPITGGVTTFFDIVWLCMVLGIMWSGTFRALSEGGMAGFAGESIRAVGQSLGKSALMLPAFAPILPGRMSPKAVWDKVNPRRIEDSLRRSSSLSEALGRMRREPAGIERMPTRDDLNRRGATGRIQNDTTTALNANAAGNAANSANAIRQLEQTLEREFNRDFQTNEQMVEALRHLESVGVIDTAQLRTLETMVATHRTPPPATPPAAPPPAPGTP